MHKAGRNMHTGPDLTYSVLSRVIAGISFVTSRSPREAYNAPQTNRNEVGLSKPPSSENILKVIFVLVK